MIIGSIGYDTIHANRIINEVLYGYLLDQIYSNNSDVYKCRKPRHNSTTLLRVKHNKCMLHIYLKKNLQISIHLSLPKLLNQGCNVNLLTNHSVTEAINTVNRITGLENIDDYDFRTFHLSRLDFATNLLVDINPYSMQSIPSPTYFKKAAAINSTVYFVATNKKVRFSDLSLLPEKEQKAKLREILTGFKRQLVLYDKPINESHGSALRFEARFKTRKIIKEQLKYEPIIESLEETDFFLRCCGYSDKLMTSIISKNYSPAANIIKMAYQESIIRV